ncbi:MAG: sigma-70 family RNA polymerase sigma factor [Haliscomenobacter sp.]
MDILSTKRVTIDPNQKIFNEELYPHHVALYRYALSLCENNADNARDLVQETYTRAFKALDSYHIGSNARAWLFVILRNLHVNGIRKNSKAKVVSLDAPTQSNNQSVGSAVSHPESLDGYSDELIYTLSDKVYDALNSIGGKYREVFILADLEDLKYEEIAEIMNTPVGTVRSRLNRSRSMLRKKLQEYGKAHGYII